MRKIILIFLFFGIGVTTVDASGGRDKDKGLWEQVFGSDEDIGGEAYKPESQREGEKRGLFSGWFSSNETEYYKPPKKTYGYADGKGPDPQPIPIDGGVAAFTFFMILYLGKRAEWLDNKSYLLATLIHAGFLFPMMILGDMLEVTIIYVDTSILLTIGTVLSVRWYVLKDRLAIKIIETKEILFVRVQRILIKIQTLGGN